MRIVIGEFISLGVVQAPGGPEEDTDGGFATAAGRGGKTIFPADGAMRMLELVSTATSPRACT